MAIHVIIAAGGLGQRFGAEQKKQFLPIQGVSCLKRSFDAFAHNPLVQSIVLVVPKDDCNRVAQEFSPRALVVSGGMSRSDSVARGFAAIENLKDQDAILVHDAARPLVPTSVIDRVIEAAQQHEAVIPAIAVRDTIKVIDAQSMVQRTVPRGSLVAVQTPQAFWGSILKKVYAELDYKNPDYTDEASLVEALGIKVKVVEGDETNIKITTPRDLKIAEGYLS